MALKKEKFEYYIWSAFDNYFPKEIDTNPANFILLVLLKMSSTWVHIVIIFWLKVSLIFSYLYFDVAIF